MKFYTINLNIKGKRCVVVGGGKVAYRKVTSLLESGAEVYVISTELNEELKMLLRERKIHFYEKEYSSGDLEGAFLVVAATDSKEINKKVAFEARRLKVIVNVIDDIELCDYIVPAITRVGDLTLSISTAGKSPSLTKKIKDELTERYGREYGELLNILGNIRGRVRDEVANPQRRKLLWKNIIDSKVLELIKEGASEKVNNLIEEIIKEYKNNERNNCR